MDFKTHVGSASALSTLAADALLVVVAGDRAPAGLDKALASALDAAVTAGDFQYKAGQALYAYRVAGVKAARVMFVHAGDASPKMLRKAVGGAVGAIKSGGAQHLLVAVCGGAEIGAADGESLVLAAEEAVYLYRHTKPSAAAASKLKSVSLVVGKAQQAAVAEGMKCGEAIAAGVTAARELANRPGNHCTPSDLADHAKKLGKTHGLKVEVLDRSDCEKLGMGSFLAVAQGSHEPPKFIVARWNGGAKGDAPIVLVGKGVTFDTGGVSIKLAAEMDEMKFDMGGAASVLGTLRAVAQLKAKVNLIGVIPATENMPDGKAVKPGDVVTSMSGQTIEILNTDAEGRLILCDALTYAQRFEPQALVDVATLTGACVIALGRFATGLMSKHDDLSNELLAAGEQVFDRAWRLPLWDEYQTQLESTFADVYNIGGRWAGAITAGCFLARFTEDQRWAHLDIAGVANDEGKRGMATGRPVGLLTQWLLDRAAGTAGN